MEIKEISMSHKKTIIGVIGASKTTKTIERDCLKLGKLIAENGWVTLTGGEPAGVMEHTLKGAAEAGGETIGILGGTKHDRFSQYATIPIFTGADIARDYYNVLTSDVIVAIGPISSGTLIEVAYALKRSVPLILYKVPKSDAVFIQKRNKDLIFTTTTLKETGEKIQKLILR